MLMSHKSTSPLLSSPYLLILINEDCSVWMLFSYYNTSLPLINNANGNLHLPIQSTASFLASVSSAIVLHDFIFWVITPSTLPPVHVHIILISFCYYCLTNSIIFSPLCHPFSSPSFLSLLRLPFKSSGSG